MPSYGIEIANLQTGEVADIAHRVQKWIAKQQSALTRKLGGTRMKEEELTWLANYARSPRFLLSSHGSPWMSLAHPYGDALDKTRRATQLVKMFSEHPDEAPAFWTWCRDQRQGKAKTQLARARWAVNHYAFEAKHGNWIFEAGDVLAYLQKIYPNEQWTRQVVDDAVKAERGKMPRKNVVKKT